MRRKLMIAALLGTTTFTPAKAHAAAVGTFLYALGGGSAFIAGAATASSFAFQAGAFFASGIGAVLGRTLLAVGLSAALTALQPRPTAPEPSSRIANFAQPVSYLEYVVGRTRKGGPLGFTGFKKGTDVVTGTGGSKRHYSVILASHPIEGVVTHYLDEREVILDDDGLVDTSPMRNLGRVRVQNGTNNTADAELVARFDEITSAHDFAGLAVAHLWARRPSSEDFAEAYPNGRQWVYGPLLDGANDVYDPRTGTYGFTRNAALVIAWVITKIWGLGVDWDEVATEADASDVLVTNAEGGTQPKWRIDGTFSDDEEFESQRAKMAAAADVWFYERADGQVGFKVGRYEEPTITLTDDDFFASNLREAGSGPDRPTEIAPQYVEPSNKWRESPAGTTILDDSDTRQVRDEPALYLISSHNQACRMASRIGSTKRAKYILSGTIGQIGRKLRGHRFLRIQTLGFDEVFEVQSLAREEGGLQFSLEARSVTSADFDYDAASQEPTKPEFKQVASDDTVDAVTGFAGVAQDGGSILYSWDEQDSGLTQQIRIRESGTTDWTTISVDSGQTSFPVTGLVDGTTYEAQIRNKTSANRVGDWSASENTQVVSNSTPPTDLDAFAASLSGSDVDVTFTAPNDENYFATRIMRADYAAGYSGSYDIASASVIRTEYGIPSNADSYTNTGLTAGHYAYWGVPINASGVEGNASGPQTVDIP